MERFLGTVFFGWNSGGTEAGHWIAGFTIGLILGGWIEKILQIRRKKDAEALEKRIKAEVDKRVSEKVNKV